MGRASRYFSCNAKVDNGHFQLVNSLKLTCTLDNPRELVCATPRLPVRGSFSSPFAEVDGMFVTRLVVVVRAL